MRKNLLIKLESSAIRSTPIEGRILADGKYTVSGSNVAFS
jgi:hypothetical protein